MSFHPLLVVVGGGAAGFFGANACTQANPKAKVILLEAGRQPLTKVRISGGGRCNVTHACFEPAVLAQNYPRGGKELRGAFTRFQPKDMVAWLNQQGVELKTEADGRMFPITDNSATVVNCLLTAAKNAGVELRTESPVVAVYPRDKSPGFEIELKSGEMLECDKLLLATGSSPRGYQIAKSLGHTIEPPVPSLFTFKIRDASLADLAGVAVKTARVRLPEAKLEQTGPVLITHWGLSGPAVLKLSAWGARFLHERRYDTPLMINWLPEYKLEILPEQMQAMRSQLPRKALATSCPFPLPRRLWERLLHAAEIDPEKRWSELSNKGIHQLITALTQSRYQIIGKGEFKEEFVTCGGISLKEVNFKTMESRLCPGLFFAGEILDIDGITGGFNFQSAWTTSWLAGQGMAN